MPRITVETRIKADINTVFDYVTNPDNWTAIWGPETTATSPQIGHSYRPGDPGLTETIRILGLVHDIHWKPLRNAPPNFYFIQGESDYAGGGDVFIFYELKEEGEYTYWKRVVIYTKHSYFHRVFIDPVLIRIYQKWFDRGIAKAKAILEARVEEKVEV